jgi:hypothetical protein
MPGSPARPPPGTRSRPPGSQQLLRSAAQDVPLIRASTDLGNVAMAAAFHRAGWVTTGHQIDMSWDRPS